MQSLWARNFFVALFVEQLKFMIALKWRELSSKQFPHPMNKYWKLIFIKDWKNTVHLNWYICDLFYQHKQEVHWIIYEREKINGHQRCLLHGFMQLGALLNDLHLIKPARSEGKKRATATCCTIIVVFLPSSSTFKNSWDFL